MNPDCTAQAVPVLLSLTKTLCCISKITKETFETPVLLPLVAEEPQVTEHVAATCQDLVTVKALPFLVPDLQT